MTNPSRRLNVRHTTTYTYDRAVERSVHLVRLRPTIDPRQYVLNHDLEVSLPVDVIEFEDVFGNSAARFEINEPYTQLSVTGRSTVELVNEDPFAFVTHFRTRPMFPLVWMPWERLMLHPYLQSTELPETQLREITTYAMSFVERNRRDLMETLFAINLALHRDYVYSPGATNVHTTPFDFFVNKRGVCQDYANLFVCMARLLDIPARYVYGYIHTGNGGCNRIGCDASHAWVQLYLPNVGWKGFDPTNGTVEHLDHVRVAHGRHYMDAAPISGTLFAPVVEHLTVDVEVLDEAPTGEPIASTAGTAQAMT